VPEPGRASASGGSGLSRIEVDLSLGTDPEAPSIHFLVTAGPPGAPGLEVDLTPVVEFTAGGQARLDAEIRGNGTRKHSGAGDVM
jgi:hypothetical protein